MAEVVKLQTARVTRIKRYLEHARRNEQEAEHYYKLVGEELKELKEEKPAGVTWKQYVRDEFDLSQERADELIRLAVGKTSLKKMRDDTAKRVAKHKSKRVLVTLESEPKARRSLSRQEKIDLWQASFSQNAEFAIGFAQRDTEKPVKGKITAIVIKAMIKEAENAIDAWTITLEYLQSLLKE